MAHGEVYSRLRRMGPGTDAHGIVQRLAHRLSQYGDGSDAETNWLVAEGRLADYMEVLDRRPNGVGADRFDLLHRDIEWRAWRGRKGDSYKNWLAALDEVANLPVTTGMRVKHAGPGTDAYEVKRRAAENFSRLYPGYDPVENWLAAERYVAEWVGEWVNTWGTGDPVESIHFYAEEKARELAAKPGGGDYGSCYDKALDFVADVAIGWGILRRTADSPKRAAVRQ